MSNGKPAKRGRGSDRSDELVPVVDRHRPRVGVEAVLDSLSAPSVVLEEGGISPAALELGMKVKWARLRNDLTQAQLAERAGLTQPAVSDIESGKGKGGPNYATLKKLADALHVDLFPVDSSEGFEGIELHMATAGADSLHDAGKEAPAASELSAAGALLRGIYGPGAFEEIRTYIEKRDSQVVGAVDYPSRIFSIASHDSVALPVSEATTLIFHSCSVAAPRQSDELKLIYGSQGDTFAMVNSAGILDLHNNGAKTALVMAIPPREFLEE